MQKRLAAWDPTVRAVKSNASHSLVHHSAYPGLSVGRRPTGLEPAGLLFVERSSARFAAEVKALFVNHITVS